MFARILVLACVFMQGVSAQEPANPRTDAHGVPLPDGAIARLGSPHYMQQAVINHIAVSADGKWVATSERLGTEPEHVNLWDAQTGRIVRTLTGLKYEIAGIEFSPSGKLLTYRDLGRVCIVDLATFRQEQWPPKGEDGGFYTGVPYYPHPAPRFLDNERLVVWHWMQQEKKRAELSHRITIWERATGKLVRDWRVVDGKIDGLKLESRAFMAGLSPSGATMAWRVLRADSKREDPFLHDVHIFDTLTGAPKGVVRNHPTSSLLASFHDIHLFDEGKTLYIKGWFPKPGHDPDGEPLSKYGVFTVLNVPTGRELYRLDHERGIFRCLAPDGKSFYTFGREDHRRDLAMGKSLSGPLTSYRRQSYYCVFGAAGDGKRTAIAHHTGWYWGDRDVKPPHAQVADPRSDAEIHFVANDQLRVRDGERAFRTWQMRDGTWVVLPSERPHPNEITQGAARFCPQRKLAIYPNGERLVIYDVEKGEERCRLDGAKFQGPGLHWPVFTGDSRRVLVPQSIAGGDDIVACWFDTQTGREQGRHRIRADEVFPGSYFVRRGNERVGYPAIDWFADDGSVFGHVARDGRLILVESATGKGRLSLKVKGTSLSDSGRGDREPVWRFGRRRGSAQLIATRQRSEKEFEHVVYDLTTGVELRRVTLPASDMDVPALSHDGRRAFVVHQGKVSAYETATGQPIGTLSVNVSKGSAVSLSPNGKWLATNCVDTSILIWDIDRPVSGTPERPLPTTVEEATQLWELLGRADPRAAEPALRRAPGPALGLMKERLRPLELNAKQIEKWIAQLDSANFKDRVLAEQNLLGLGDPALLAVRQALAKPVSLEHRRRLEGVITRIGEPSIVPGCLRELRALEVLERIGTPEAKTLVARLATGDPAIHATREARLVLARWR